MNLIPKPNGIAEVYPQIYKLKGESGTIAVGEFSDNSIQAFCDRKSFKGVQKAADMCDIILQKERGFKEEEYEVSVDTKGAVIKASADRGIIYGLTTLYLLMDKADEIPFCHIHDEPKYSHRGLSLDCVRNFLPAAEIKAIIEPMSLVKMNTLHLHFTDDQSWGIECRKYPKLHIQNGDKYLSQKEIKEIVAFAESRGIEVVPEIEMPGHVSALLEAYPQYSCSKVPVKRAVCGGIYPVILCAGNEDTYGMIEEILDELCTLFPSKRFHIGGDEAPKKEWKKCGCCRQKMKEQNLDTVEELQGYFSNRIAQILKKKGKTPICWNDSLMAGNLSRESQIQFWSVQYEDYFEPFIEREGKFIYSDMFTYYFDYPYSMSPLKRVYNEPPTVKDVDYTGHPSMLGIEACIWAEHIKDTERLEKLLFPRIYAVAEKTWSFEQNYDSFQERLRKFLKEYHPGGIAYTPEEAWDPQGKRRQEETFSYFIGMNEAMPEDVRKETVESAAPGEAFQKKFMSAFFEPEDMPLLMKMM